MITQELFWQIRDVLGFMFYTVLTPIWNLYTKTILAFVIVAWVFAHIIKFFKRFI